MRAGILRNRQQRSRARRVKISSGDVCAAGAPSLPCMLANNDAENGGHETRRHGASRHFYAEIRVKSSRPADTHDVQLRSLRIL